MTEELKPCPRERCVKACKEVERMRNLLEDVVNALDLSDIAIETHGPLGTEPAELVKLVLIQKDLEIKMLKARNTLYEPSGCVIMSFRNEVIDFATAMEITLKLNEHKGGWKDESIEFLVSRLENEVTELKSALDFATYPEEKQAECVDIANFAMMLFDVLSLRKEDVKNEDVSWIKPRTNKVSLKKVSTADLVGELLTRDDQYLVYRNDEGCLTIDLNAIIPLLTTEKLIEELKTRSHDEFCPVLNEVGHPICVFVTPTEALVKELESRSGIESTEIECEDGIAKTIVIHGWNES